MNDVVWIFISAMVVKCPGVETPGCTPSPLRGGAPGDLRLSAAINGCRGASHE